MRLQKSFKQAKSLCIDGGGIFCTFPVIRSNSFCVVLSPADSSLFGSLFTIIDISILFESSDELGHVLDSVGQAC